MCSKKTDQAKTSVFISYSRRDIEFVDRLQKALSDRGVEAAVDRSEIAKGEEWWARIEQLITGADTIVFVLSPDSAKSEICQDEVDLAVSLNKRFLPVVARDLAGTPAPHALSQLNYIFFFPLPAVGASGDFDEAVDDLVNALSTDIGWIREHTRLGSLAKRWETHNKRKDLLLRGTELAAAESWLTNRPKNAPEPTSTHRALIEQSRIATKRRQRNWAIGAVSASILTFVGGFLWYQQKQTALQEQRRASIEEARKLAELATGLVKQGDPMTAALVGLEVGTVGQFATVQKEVSEIGVSLHRALHAGPGSWVISGHSEGVTDMQISPDGSMIATASHDRTVRLWDAETGTQKAILHGHFEKVGRVRFSPDGQRLVSASDDGVAILWETKSGRLIRRLYGHSGPIADVIMSPSGKRLATISTALHHGREGNILSEDGVENARIWNGETGDFVSEINPKYETTGNAAKVNAIHFLSDNEALVLQGFAAFTRPMTGGFGGGKAGIWDVSSGQLKRMLEAPPD